MPSIACAARNLDPELEPTSLPSERRVRRAQAGWSGMSRLYLDNAGRALRARRAFLALKRGGSQTGSNIVEVPEGTKADQPRLALVGIGGLIVAPYLPFIARMLRDHVVDGRSP